MSHGEKERMEDY